jgi:hypothetical protein
VTRDSVLAREGQTHAIAGASESSPPAAFWFTKKLRSSSLSLCDPETAAFFYALRYSHFTNGIHTRCGILVPSGMRLRGERDL